ncbi:MAG: amidohydrolase [Clostridia bacterium]|nr:amidohydrolase [Clostridia bacterium]
MKEIGQVVEKYRSLILEAEKYIWEHPETGYKEVKTSAYMAEQFEKLGYTLAYAEGITGFYTQIDTGRAGPEILILGELDSIICPTHPEADKQTGAVHSCGHNGQCAALLGVAAALKEEGILSQLSGKIRLCAVPAEELLEMEYRTKLMQEGKIRYFGGKSEFLSRGYFDGVDLAFMVHLAENSLVRLGSVGIIAKTITYKGVAAHAGGSPWNGKNALYAANCGLSAVNALRETFQEKDLIRWHPILTHGGDMVNAIPETATIESYVRGLYLDSIVRESKKIDRALIGAALSFGINVEIVDEPGYAPLQNDRRMIQVAKEAYEAITGEPLEVQEVYSTGSTDMGDLSTIMPVVHPYIGGCVGKTHGNDYHIIDKERACVTNAKWQVAMLIALMGNGAELAKEIVENYKPVFASKEEFLAYQDLLKQKGDRIEYRSDGSAVIKG